MSNQHPPVIVNIVQAPSAPDPKPSGGHADNPNIFLILVLVATFGFAAIAVGGGD